MFMLDTTQILVASIIAVSTSILIFYLGYGTGRFVQASMARQQLENISAQVYSYNEWLEYFKRGITYSRNRRMMRIDFTLTTPGLFELENICKLSDELGVDILAKVVFAFDPTIAMSPLFLPRDILDAIISVVPAPQTDDNAPLKALIFDK